MSASVTFQVESIREVQVLSLQPGDILVVVTDVAITNEQAERIKAQLGEWVPKFVRDVLVLDQMHFEVIRGGDPS